MAEETAGGAPVDRGRRFVNFILGGGLLGLLGSIFYPVIRFVIPPLQSEATQTTVVAAKVDELGPNEGKVFRFGNRPGILIRLSDGSYRAFDAVCQHLQCTVQYRDDLQEIWCACHNGHYDLKGRNISGPPPRPLDEFMVNVVQDEIVVSAPKPVV